MIIIQINLFKNIRFVMKYYLRYSFFLFLFVNCSPSKFHSWSVFFWLLVVPLNFCFVFVLLIPWRTDGSTSYSHYVCCVPVGWLRQKVSYSLVPVTYFECACMSLVDIYLEQSIYNKWVEAFLLLLNQSSWMVNDD